MDPQDEEKMMKDAKEIFQQAVEAVLPLQMIDNTLHFEEDTLKVSGHSYKLSHNVYVVGFGKAVLGMARAVEDKIGAHVVRGAISVPLGIQSVFQEKGKQHMLVREESKIRVYEGAADNLPDDAAHRAAMAIQDIVVNAKEGDVVLVLISGGGSALLPAPVPPVTLSDMLSVTRQLSHAGAAITELNSVRKALDAMKGGGLAQLAQPAQVISLILSDIVNNPLDFIASGPTVQNETSPQECLQILRKYDLLHTVPQSAVKFLERRVEERKSRSGETSLVWANVHNVLMGTNQIACQRAAKHSEMLGYSPVLLCTDLEGEAGHVGKMFATLGQFLSLNSGANFTSQDHEKVSEIRAQLISEYGLSGEKLEEIVNTFQTEAASKGQCSDLCIISGGETTVHVTGDGKGGRNQEMVLTAAIELHRAFQEPVSQTENPKSSVGLSFLSAGTDGQDGPTPAAGAVVGTGFISTSLQAGLDCEDHLRRNDSHTLFSKVENGKHLVMTGPTGTNVMDIQVLLVRFGFGGQS